MFNLLTLAIALLVLGIGMLIAGIYTLSKRNNEDEEPAKESDRSTMGNWMFGSHSGMDKKRAGRARVTIGIIFFIGALICLAEYYL